MAAWNALGDISPSLVAGGVRSTLIYFGLPMIGSLILSIIGIKKRNRFRYLGLILNLIALLYVVVPTGILVMVLTL